MELQRETEINQFKVGTTDPRCRERIYPFRYCGMHKYIPYVF